MKFERKKIGRILVEMGTITSAEVEMLLEKLQIDGKNFGETGLAEGFFNEEQLAQALARQFGYEFVDLKTTFLDPELMALLPAGVPLRNKLVPLRRDDDVLTVAVANPTDVQMLDHLEMQLGLRLQLKVASRTQIEKLLERGEGSRRVLREASEDFKLQLIKETDKGDEVLSIEKLTADTSPIIRLIDSTLYDALIKRASDIHIESTAGGGGYQVPD